MYKKLLFLFIILTVLGIITGCQTASPVTEPSPTKLADSTSSATTEAGAELFDSYRVPETIPQPTTGKGSVVGQLTVDNLEDLRGAILYLGELIVVEEGKYGGFLDTTKAPSTTVDLTNGKFFFQDVEPGEYSLILYEIGLGGKALTESSGSVMLIAVKEGEITDLSAIDFTRAQ